MDDRFALVEFQGDQLLTIFDGQTVRVAMKAMVEGLGLGWGSQRQKIMDDPVLSKGVTLSVIPSERGAQETVTLPLDLMQGWLFKLNPSRVAPEARERVIAYQRECYQVLHDYWIKGAAFNPRMNQIEHSDRTARRRELPALLDRLEKERHPEKRRVIYELVVRACEAEGITPPAFDAIAPPPDLFPAVAEQFFAGLSKLAEAGVEIEHHRNPTILAVSLPEVAAAFADHGIENSRRAELLPALRDHAAFINSGPVNCRDGKSRSCWTFVRAKLPA